MPTPHEICTALRAYRIRARLQQSRVAECLGVAQSQISRWESGRDLPRAHNIDAIRRLIWGPEGDPLAALKHFVAGSRAPLLLLDAGYTILERALPFRQSSNLLERFGWVLDPARNPGFAPAHRRYKALMQQPNGVIGMSLAVPFMAEDGPRVAEIDKTIYAVAGTPICLAELRFTAADGEETLQMVETRLGEDGAPRAATTVWRARPE